MRKRTSQYPELLWRAPLAIVGGLVALYIYPTENVWVLAPLVPALVLLATLGTGFWAATGLGFLAGQAFYISHIEWISLYLGPVPLLALSTLMSIYFALGVGLTAWLFRKLKPSQNRYLSFAFVAATIWVIREWLGANFPYGGFPWSRLGMSQADGLLAGWAFWGGISLISFVIALLGAMIAMLVLSAKSKKLKRLPYLVTAAVLVLTPLLPTALLNQSTSSAVIAAVQGNAKAGLFANQTPGTILQNHLDASQLIFDSPLADQLDLVVWPENASDVDPLRSQTARQKISEFASKVQVPFTFGTITKRGEESFNTTLLWQGDSAYDYYDKKRPVPFAEYVPDRAFWRTLAPDLIDLVPRGYSFGVRDGLFELENFNAGSLICFEIAIDSIPRELAASGADVILSQTNNADFGYSDETFQQAAIAKLRAIETGRAVVNISTVGQSAIYLPDGSTLASLTWYQPGAMVERVPLYQGTTPAVVLGAYVELILALAALGLILVRLRR